MKLSIVIVNYNVEHFLEQCLHSVIKAAQNISYEIIVVDNNSVDGSLAMLKKKFGQVILIANEKNTGFSFANNQGIKITKGDYILLLNPDTVVQEDSFEKTLAFMDSHPDAGALGVMMLDGKGNFLPESKRGLPTPIVAFYKVFGFSKLFPKSKIFGRYHLGFLDKNKTHEVDILSGAFMLFRKSTLDKTGLLDETFFMYGEDIDISYRVTLAGYKNYYYPETKIIHYKGESTKKSSANYVLVFYNAMLIFAKKHFAKEQAKLFSTLIYFAIVVRAGLSLAKRIIEQTFVPLLDAVLLYGGLLFLKDYYAYNIKFTTISGTYPDDLVWVAFAAYVFVWISSIFLSGGYDKPIRFQKITRGIFIGTGIILAFYALLPETYRFSRALILIGTGWVTLSMLGTRMFFHLLQINGFRLEGSVSKRIAIAGDEEEYKRIISLLKESSIKTSFTGFIFTEEHQTTTNTYSTLSYLGKFSQMEEIIKIYKINEIIFCAKNLSAEKIIEAMWPQRNISVEFKIAPSESLSIIGSNSIDTAGDLYTIDINSINKPSNRRKKRVMDVVMALLFIPLLPCLVFIVKKPFSFISNIFKVLFGFNTWVGAIRTLPNNKTILAEKGSGIKPGILSPSDAFPSNHITPEVAECLNKIYSKDYSAENDLSIVMKGIRNLGR